MFASPLKGLKVKSVTFRPILPDKSHLSVLVTYWSDINPEEDGALQSFICKSDEAKEVLIQWGLVDGK